MIIIIFKQIFVNTRFVSHFQVHRVVIPEAPSDREKVRMSVAYFMQPDPDCLVQGLDGSDKYEPITSLEFLKMKLKATHSEQITPELFLFSLPIENTFPVLFIMIALVISAV